VTAPETRSVEPPRSSRSAAAFVVALLALLGAVFPFVGFLGVVAIVIGARDRGTQRRRLRVAAVVIGGAAAAVASGWVVVFCEPAKGVAEASCPRVYSWDGARYQLDTSVVASSLYPWAQRLDVDRAAHLRPHDGSYRLQVRNDFDVVGHVDSLELWLVDHEAGIEILPTTKGNLVAVKDARPPSRAADAAGADVLPLLLAADGRAPAGAIVTGEDGEPRWAWTLEFSRPEAARALLVLRGRGTELAQRAFGGYLASMGRGMGPLMEIVENDDDGSCACQEALLSEELALLHMPLVVTVAPGVEGAVRYEVLPIGPAMARRFALPIELPGGAGDRVTVRLESTPRFWEIDQAEIAPDPGVDVAPQGLAPRAAERVSAAGREDVLEWITGSDRRRAPLRTGEILEASFAAPPAAPGLERSVFVALRGFYQVPVGGRRFVDPAAILAHRWGLRSLPRFAAALP
jgi:hypothetical protein